ncbi:MAG: hypothetical protein JWQ63_2377 [Mucilaginibacter sp.]|nr:hypothetical protein [Mucilaginibacter sp.]
MKKTLLIALLLIPFLGISQTTKPVDGFLGIKFGSSRAAVIAALNAKGGILGKKESTPEFLYYKNIKLGHRDAGAFMVKFVDDKAFEADFIFDPGLDAKTIEYYKILVNDISENYGKGFDHKNYQEPYNNEDDDGIKIDAMKDGKVEYFTIWQSEPSKNTIKASVDVSLAVILKYQDSELVGRVIDKQKAKEKSDF